MLPSNLPLLASSASRLSQSLPATVHQVPSNECRPGFYTALKCGSKSTSTHVAAATSAI